MKVIFRQDVPKVGRRYEIKDVSDGYARNYLVPNQLADIATDANKKAIEESQRHQVEKKQERDQKLSQDLQKLSGVVVTFHEKASESGSLFSGISREDIVAKLREAEPVDVDVEHVLLEQPIKTLGETSVKVSAGEESVEIAVKVEEVKAEKSETDTEETEEES